MNKVYFKAFSILVVFYFSHSAISCTGAERDLAINIERVANGLFAGSQIKQKTMDDIFEEIKIIETNSQRNSDASDFGRKSDESKDSHTSEDSASSVSSQEAIDGFATIMDLCFEERYKTPKAIEERKNFICMLHSLENSIPAKIMIRTVALLSEQLFG